MAANGRQLGAVRAWLHGQGITAVSDEWLAACLEHVAGSVGGTPSTAQLQRLVLDQWLDTDLAALAVAVLPPRLAQQPLVTLRQPCAVQLLSVVDVSQPAHGQLLKLRRVDSSNTEVGEPRAPWEPRASRALRLTLTDGVQQVSALECEPLPALSTASPAGLKLLLRPPLECRRGVLLLSAGSVSVLGGAVEELQDPRAEQRVLEERLRAAGGLPPGPSDEDSGYRSDQAGVARAGPAPEPDLFDDGLDDADLAAIPDIPDDGIDDADLAALEMPNGDAVVGAGDPASSAAAVAAFDDADDVDDAELASLDLDSLVDSAVERAVAPEPVAVPDPQSAPASVKRRRTEPWDSDRPAPAQNRAPRSLDSSVTASSGRGKPTQRQQSLDTYIRSGALSSQAAPASVSAPASRPDHPQRSSGYTASPVRVAPSFDLSSWLEPDEPPAPPPEPPFGYLSQWRPGQSLTVKAFIMTMTSSLNISGGRWRLEVKLNDGTRSADAVLTDAILSDIIGLSLAEADRMRAAGRTDPASRNRLRGILCRAQTAIIRLSCLMRLEPGEDPDGPPLITRLTEVGPETVRALRACVDSHR
ncbi:recQ-mediated genome instability protein 1-like [Amphibalanus amphitrite]|uniref:recQ-mediated genome instability protein 1-like n=1 Tax=Amphibalanus amphitrite TaxID=1232801 RepID=UPI001C921C36|nr:recQ-mediated genome instability protein 1-like [Amphibalanus amphitrite]